MKEAITIEIGGKPLVIGYCCMMMPTSRCEVNKVYKMLRLTADLGNEGSTFFFKYRILGDGKEDWCLSSEHSYISINEQENLLKMFQNLPRNKAITWDKFIELIIKTSHQNC